MLECSYTKIRWWYWLTIPSISRLVLIMYITTSEFLSMYVWVCFLVNDAWIVRNCFAWSPHVLVDNYCLYLTIISVRYHSNVIKISLFSHFNTLAEIKRAHTKLKAENMKENEEDWIGIYCGRCYPFGDCICWVSISVFVRAIYDTLQPLYRDSINEVLCNKLALLCQMTAAMDALFHDDQTSLHKN